MAENNDPRFVGVIGEGSTDREILGRLVETCLAGNCRIVPLKRQSLRDGIDRFWKQAASAKHCGFPGEPANDLTKMVTNVLLVAVDDFQSLVERSLEGRDFVILSSDAERHLVHTDRYFDDWAWVVGKVVHRGIERFYHVKSQQGFDRRFLPMVSTFVPFPSTEILISAFKGEDSFRGKKALELKQAIYGTTNLHALKPDDLQKLALAFLNEDGLAHVYKHVPEARGLLQLLAVAEK